MLTPKDSASCVGSSGQSHWNAHAATISHDLYLNSIADLVFVQNTVEFVIVRYLFAIDADDNVSKLNVTILGLR